MTVPLERIVPALLEGLEYRESDVTPTARKALERAAKELGGLEGLELDVLRKSRKLWEATRPETQLLLVSRIPLFYPDLARVWRKTETRRLRDERERLERHALYETTQGYATVQ